MNTNYIKSGWTLYYEDQYGNYLDWDGYNPSGYKWNGNTWIDINDKSYEYFSIEVIKNKSLIEKYPFYIRLDNELFFEWEIKFQHLS